MGKAASSIWEMVISSEGEMELRRRASVGLKGSSVADCTGTVAWLCDWLGAESVAVGAGVASATSGVGAPRASNESGAAVGGGVGGAA